MQLNFMPEKMTLLHCVRMRKRQAKRPTAEQNRTICIVFTIDKKILQSNGMQ